MTFNLCQTSNKNHMCLFEMGSLENDAQNGEKPTRKLTNTVLDNFSKLSNPHENVRVKGAANLLKYIAENSETEEGIKELKYALKRLIRGLGAPTLTARAGFYSTLVALLNLQLPVTCTNVLDIIKAELHKSGKNSDGENADICTGQILACGAVIKSALWGKSEPEHKKEILHVLLAAAKERIYLGLFGYAFVVELLNHVAKIEDKELIKDVTSEVSKPWSEQSLDSLYLLLELKLACPKELNKKFIKNFLGSPELICEDSLERLCSILMTIPRVTSLKHPVYDTVVKYLTPAVLPEFFRELDKHLKTPNRNRLLVFIKILTNTLAYACKAEENVEHIPVMFTNNFIIQLLGYFRTFKGKQKDSEYHKAVQSVFEALLDVFKKENANSTLKIAIIKKLLFYPGTFVFEKVTKSKIVQQITSTLDSEGVKSLAAVYRGVTEGTEKIDSENDSETWVNNDRLYSAHLLIKLLSLPAIKQDSAWIVEQLQFLLNASLLKGNGLNIGRELAESLKTAFFGALDLKFPKLEDLRAVLLKLVLSLDAKLNPENLEVLPRTPISEETYQLWKKTLQTINKIEKKQKKSGVTSVFLTLFLHMGLQLFNDVKLATDSLNELFSCYDRVKQNKKAHRTLDETALESTTATEAEAENDPLWIEVVVDLFLNLLSHNSHLLRSIIKSVFPHLCKYMTSNTIHQILNVLDPKSDDNPLSNDNEMSDDSEEERDHSESEDSDASQESDDDDDDDDDETTTDKLRMALHQALSNGKNESDDDESIDLDQMSDTDGERLDKALADAFRQFKPNHGKRKKQSKDQETLTHFRVRVLDLIEIYLDSNPSMLVALEIMLPLLQAVEFSIKDEHQKPLNERLRAILKKLLGSKKFCDTDGVNDEVLVELLKSLLDKGNKNALIMQEIGEQVSDCCIFVVKCSEMLRNNEEVPPKVKKHLKSRILEVILGELHEFFTKRDHLTPYVLFKNLLQLSWEGNIGLASTLLDFLFSAEIRPFRKNQVAELLKIFYSNQRFFSQYKDKASSKMREAHGTFSARVIEYFNSLCENPDQRNVKERFVCNFLNLLTAMKNCPIEQSKISWPDIAESIREYRSYKSFSKDAKVAFNKLCRTLNVSNIVAMKQQVTKLASLIEDDANSVASEKKEKKKHKRKNPETLKLKKEAKQLRLNSLGKGLGGIEFEDAGVSVDVSPEDDANEEEEEQEETPKTKKRKTSETSVINGSHQGSKVKLKKARRNSTFQPNSN